MYSSYYWIATWLLSTTFLSSDARLTTGSSSSSRPRRRQLSEEILNHPKFRRASEQDEIEDGRFIVHESISNSDSAGGDRFRVASTTHMLCQQLVEGASDADGGDGGSRGRCGKILSNGYFVVEDPSDESMAALLLSHDILSVEHVLTFRVEIAVVAFPWGLDRLDQEEYPLDGSFTHKYNGAGVDIYTLDTGIRTTHEEFGNRATCLADMTGEGCGDEHGHGTHVSGTAAGSTKGVANGAELFDVKVMDKNGSGGSDRVIAGIDEVTERKRDRPSVLNMSLSGGFSAAVNAAVARAVAKGIVVVTAAGNQGSDACNRSPASADDAITVGATESGQSDGVDRRASFSSYGSCVDVFAPGDGILSSHKNCDDCYATWGGTSMATPHVTGLAAHYLQMNPSMTPAEVAQAIKDHSLKGRIANPGEGSPNMIASAMTVSTMTQGTGPGQVEQDSPADVGGDKVLVNCADCKNIMKTAVKKGLFGKCRRMCPKKLRKRLGLPAGGTADNFSCLDMCKSWFKQGHDDSINGICQFHDYCATPTSKL